MNCEDIIIAKIGHPPPYNQHERCCIAASLGYLDARFIVKLKDTHGFPIENALDVGAKSGLKPDWRGIESELYLQSNMSLDKAKRVVASMRREYYLTHE